MIKYVCDLCNDEVTCEGLKVLIAERVNRRSLIEIRRAKDHPDIKFQICNDCLSGVYKTFQKLNW